MYWWFYIFLRTVLGFSPLLFWIAHIILFAISLNSFKRPGRIFFLIPGVLFCIFDLKWEFFNGSTHYPLILFVIEVILIITGAIIVWEFSGGFIDRIIGIITSFIQGYMFGVLGIIIISAIGGTIGIIIVTIIILIIAAGFYFT